MGRAVFISDVHLGGREKRKLERLVPILSEGETVYLLGDIFEYWAGRDQIREPAYAELARVLHRLSRSGTMFFFIGGNRDFLVDRSFERATGVRILGEGATVVLGRLRVRLEHGDGRFARPRSGSTYRGVAGLEIVREAVQRMPLGVLRGIGRVARGLSRGRPARWTEEEIFRRVRPVLETHDAIVCGHIHQPGIFERTINGRLRQVVVLGDWDHGGEYAVFEEGFELKRGG